MKLKILSDIHLEVNGSWFDIDHEPADVLILAGDVCPLFRDLTWIGWIGEWSEIYEHIIWVPGNHEYWGSSLNLAVIKAEHFLSHNNITNVHIIERDTLVLDGIAFICATLWTDYDNSNPLVMLDAQRFIQDFSKIRHGPVGDPYQRLITPELILSTHQEDVNHIRQSLDLHGDKKCVVVTHHAPSWQSVSPGYIGDRLNGAYVSDLEKIMKEHDPELWIHGHTHSSFDYTVWNTRVLCNPVGYGKENIRGFLPNLVIEV